jgi:hypothetical protein
MDGPMICITTHAIDRYVERVAPSCSRQEALAAIMSRKKALEAAADFAGNASVTVRLADGVRFVLRDWHVLTTLGAEGR